jgi:60 kDa SS-A/Ro ribonucleoprotein
MASLNKEIKSDPVYTAPGAIAAKITPLLSLRRATMACMLWEDNAYIDGVSLAEHIKGLVHAVRLDEASEVAIEAREKQHLRHIPLLIVREMARHPKLASGPKIVSQTLARVIQRPDELSEFMAIYWKDGKVSLSKQVKLGLQQAFTKFNEYSLAKYNRDKAIKLRDVLFLSHPKPKDVPEDFPLWNAAARQMYKGVDDAARLDLLRHIRPDGFTENEKLFSKLVYDQLKMPDTWENQLSTLGQDKSLDKEATKKATFERLMHENNLGDLAFLRNLRNMTQASVHRQQIIDYGNQLKWGRVLPFRFLAAARIVPDMEPHLENWMFKCLTDMPKLRGSTLLIVDTSGSMGQPISGKSDLTRLDAAGALTALAREICEDPTIYVTAGDDHTRIHKTKLVPARKGFALIDYVSGNRSKSAGCYSDVGGGGIFLTQCLDFIHNEQKGRVFDRVMVFTDEQDCDLKLNPTNAKLLGKINYMINIATEKHGIGYKKWTHLDGFSEAIIDYIIQSEEQPQ